ncbi:MAG: OmpA family protein [Terracidiphilus sp.]
MPDAATQHDECVFERSRAKHRSQIAGCVCQGAHERMSDIPGQASRRKADKTMSHMRVLKGLRAVTGFIFVCIMSTVAVTAQSTEVNGIIKARSGDTMLLQKSDASEITVYLADTTDVAQVEGMLKARHKEMSMAALVPGLPVKVKGHYDADNNHFVADTVRFKGNDLQQAKAIQAGMSETKQRAEVNKQAIAENQAAIAENQAAIGKNQAAINEAVARFGQLDDYYIFDELTIYFGNAKTNVEQQYVSQLQALAEKARTINGYMIEVKGFASATGNTASNQALSEDRADNVTNILLQQCKVPMTRMLAPGAMGESEQVGSPSTKEGEAQNRRVVVRVLQNKAIAAKPAE